MIATLRRAAEFVRQAPKAESAHAGSEPILGESFGADRLARHARQLARKHAQLVQPPPGRASQRGRGQLLSRLDVVQRVRTLQFEGSSAPASPEE